MAGLPDSLEHALLNAHDRYAAWFFVIAFVVVGLAEFVLPRRARPDARTDDGPPAASDGRRWTANLALFALGTAIALALPFQWPPTWRLDQALGLGEWQVVSRLVVDLLLLDLLRYAIHRVHHAVPVLWRVHAIHHSDTTLDVTTTVRHHPIESVLVRLVVLAGAGAWGASLVAIAVYALLAAVVPLFHHAAIALPAPLARVLRAVVVTPDVHAIHHSADPRDVDRNFGMILTWWDHLFGTYRAPTRRDATDLRFGLDGVAPAQAASFLAQLALPVNGPWSRRTRAE